MNKTITARELKPLLENGSVTLIDVMLPEDFACRRIAGAKNACVYEMVFLERIAECAADQSCAIVLYDESGTSRAAETAHEKLERAGYRQVAILQGGLRGWQEAGFEMECLTVAEEPRIHDGSYTIDSGASVVEWSGRNINNRHYGRISVSEGAVTLAGGRPVSGHFLLDMSSIVNLDLQDDGWRSVLHRHLMSDDFFDVEQYPFARFDLSGSAPVAGASAGTPNFEVAGKLTVKDVTRPLCFPAIIAAQADGTLKAQAMIDLDRTLWNVCYGSGKLYERLGMHLVNDLISVELFLVARCSEE